MLDKVVAAARQRKRRAIAVLRDAGLIQIAEHFRDYYIIKARTFSYCPEAKPHWLLGKPAYTSIKYESHKTFRERAVSSPACLETAEPNLSTGCTWEVARRKAVFINPATGF